MQPTFLRGLRLLHRFEDSALISALALMLFIAIMQISLRNFFDAGVFWAESFLRTLVLWVAMLGAMVATRESNHINIDALSHYLRPNVKRVVHLFTQLFSSMICAIAAYYSFEFVQFEYEDKTIAFASVPTWVAQSIIPIGFTVMSVRFAITGITRFLRPA